MTVKELVKDFEVNRQNDIIIICDTDTSEELAIYKFENNGKLDLLKSEFAEHEIDYHSIEIGTYKTNLVTEQALTGYYIEWRIYVYPEE